MMTSDEKTSVSSLISYIRSDLFTLENISSSVILNVPNDDTNTTQDVDENGNEIYISPTKWETVIQYLPLEYYRLIESYPNMYTVEDFDKKYIRNPKLCAYERYDTTNMWRPLMILNRCTSITKFDFEYIRYYNITTFTRVLSVLISRAAMMNNG